MTDSPPPPRILVVDLDDTLLATDTLHEQLAALLFRKPSLLPAALGALAKGRPALKRYLADAVPLDVSLLPIRDEVLQLIETRREAGWSIALCTAADRQIAENVARHTGLFDTVLATDGAVNNKGEDKAALLAARFPQGFEYAGDAMADLPVWRAAQGTILVAATPAVARAARQLPTKVIAEIPARSDAVPSLAHDWLKALRLHHGAKNLLLFLPLLLAHQWADPGALAKVFSGFVLLMMVTSSTYLINDLADLEADRRHRSKRFRPLAAGRIPIRIALPGAFVAIVWAMVLAYVLEPMFGMALTAYLVITLGYSFGLKRIPLLDAFLIGVLFTTRLAMGMTLHNAPYSAWLLVFSLFLFTSLAMAKRHVEFVAARLQAGGNLAARGYRPEDEIITLIFGITAGIASLVVLVLFLAEELFRRVVYTRPELLWLFPMILAIWIGRIWLLANRGELNDDPVLFALHDRASLGLGAAVFAVFLLAL